MCHPLSQMLQQLICPISHALPIDPVIAEDGALYDREYIETHLQTRFSSPLTNLYMGSRLMKARHVTNILQGLVNTGHEDELLDDWAKAVANANRTDTLPDGKVQVYRDGKHIRTEYVSTHPLHGTIEHFERGKHVRTEFVAPSSNPGLIFFHDDNGRVERTEYAVSHPDHGEICSFAKDDPNCWQIWYKQPHAKAGQKEFHEYGQHVRTVFGSTHPEFGSTKFYEAGVHVRTEYHRRHPNYRFTDFFEDDKLVRRFNEWSNELEHYENDELVRCVCSDGETRFYENLEHVRSEFGPEHPNHGEIVTYDQSGACRCIQYAKDHPNYGEIDLFDEDEEYTHTKFEDFHPNHGRIDAITDEVKSSTFEAFHPDHGKIVHWDVPNDEATLVFWENGTHVRTEFGPDHPNYGEIRIMTNNRHTRTEFATFHSMHGVVFIFEKGKQVRTEFASSHPNHGQVHVLDGANAQTGIGAGRVSRKRTNHPLLRAMKKARM